MHIINNKKGASTRNPASAPVFAVYRTIIYKNSDSATLCGALSTDYSHNQFRLNTKQYQLITVL